MSDPSGAPVLVGADGSGPSVVAVAWAAEEASGRGTDLRVVCVTGGHCPSPVTARGVLDRARTVAHLTAPALTVRAEMVSGDPAEVLGRLATGAVAVVVGHHGAGGLPSPALGSVAAVLTRTVETMLVVVRFAPGRPVPDRARPILVGVAGSPLDVPVLREAAGLALRRGARLHAVHVWSEHLGGALRRLGQRGRGPGREAAERALDAALSPTAAAHPDLDLTPEVIRGHPVWALLELSDSSQLVVAGVHGRHGLRARVTDPVALALVQAAHCPVAVVPVGYPGGPSQFGDSCVSDAARPRATGGRAQ